ncbi:MAG: DUF4339 domain-containing protein [Pirellulales bacterium]|nr:DUF4339 domain-containing protein [Pirellulales bacterium]
MGIRFRCPQGHKIHVKSWMAGKRGLCPTCQEKIEIPAQSTAEFLAADSDPALVAQNPAATTPAQPQVSLAPHPSQEIPQTAVPAMPAIVHDPLAENPQAQWYVRHATGQQFGPALGTLLVKWLQEGRIPPDALLWREGWNEWQAAPRVFPQLATRFPPAAISQPAAPAPYAVGTPAAPVITGQPQAHPLDFDAGGRTGGGSPVVYRRRDNSQTVLIVSLLLLLLIAILGGIFAYVISNPPTDENSLWRPKGSVAPRTDTRAI